LKTLSKGLTALAKDDVEVISAHQTTRAVDVQFVVPRNALSQSISALHKAFFQAANHPTEVMPAPREAA
jgi:aspartate kinase